MASKQKTVVLKFTPRFIDRGEWGKQFYISTFRFPIKEAQAFERRAKGMGLTMSSLVNQLVMTLNKTLPEPKKAVKLERTAHPTIWGAVEKKKFFQKKGLKVPVKREDKPVARKPKVQAKPAPKANRVVVTKKVAKPEVKKASNAAALLAKIRAMRKDAAA